MSKHIPRVAEVPSGYRGVQKCESYSPKCVRVAYYDWDLLVPRKAVVKCGDRYWVQAWAIESAKDRPQFNLRKSRAA